MVHCLRPLPGIIISLMNNKYISHNLRYMLVHGFYQVLIILVVSYASYYLLDKGFTDGTIGVILAIGNGASAILMPVSGNFLDRHPKVSLHLFAVINLAVMIVLSICLLFMKGATWPLAVVMILVLTLVLAFQPLINSLCFLLESTGVKLNFGLSRGFGSISFAIVSAIIGTALQKIAPSLLPAFYIAAFLMLGIMFLSLPVKKQEKKEESSKEEEKALPLSKFVVTYRRYMLFLLGSGLIMIFLQATGCYFTYQIIVSLGGGTKEQGFALAIAAMVELPAMVLSSWLVKKWGAKWVLRISALFFIIKFVILMLSTSVVMFYIGQTFQFFSFGFFFPVAAVYTAQVLPKADMVKGQSLFTTMNSAAGLLSSLIGGMILEKASIMSMEICFFILAAIGFVITFFSVQDTKKG